MPRPAGKGKLAQLCASSVSYEPVLLLNPDIRALVDRIRATGNLHRKLGRQELVSTAAASGLGLVASDLDRLFQRFDPRNTGFINAVELVESLRRANSTPTGIDKQRKSAHGLLLTSALAPAPAPAALDQIIYVKSQTDAQSKTSTQSLQQQLDQAMRRLKALTRRATPEEMRACRRRVVELCSARAMVLVGEGAHAEALTLLNVAESLVAKGSAHEAALANNFACYYKQQGHLQVHAVRGSDVCNATLITACVTKLRRSRHETVANTWNPQAGGTRSLRIEAERTKAEHSPRSSPLADGAGTVEACGDH